jgi:hypothetical protein
MALKGGEIMAHVDRIKIQEQYRSRLEIIVRLFCTDAINEDEFLRRIPVEYDNFVHLDKADKEIEAYLIGKK